jgi:hypothetical protein
MQPALLDRARTVSQRHADLLRGALGEEVLAVWLVGSAMLGDLSEDSDVDTVTLTDAPLGPEHADALREVHDTLAREFEGVRWAPPGWRCWSPGRRVGGRSRPRPRPDGG